MIGVDIVDLHQNFNRRPQEFYLNKLAGVDEAIPMDFPYPVHLLWALKEAIYKCHYQQQGETFISPKKIKIRKIDSGDHTFTAECNDCMYTGHFFPGNNYIYAVAWPVSSHHPSPVFITYLTLQENHTIEKELRYYASELGSDVTLETTTTSFPSQVRTAGHTYAYSKSHDGKWYLSMIKRGSI